MAQTRLDGYRLRLLLIDDCDWWPDANPKTAVKTINYAVVGSQQ